MSESTAKEDRASQWISLSELDWPAAADAFNCCYSGYLIPINMSAEDVRLRVLAESIDRNQSYVVYDLESPIGMAFVSRRGTASRLAAFGVAPTCRRFGLGRSILARVVDDAVKRRDSTLELEVIDGNIAAAALYQAFGFCTVDTLLGFEIETQPALGCGLLRKEGVERIVAAIAEDSPNPLPWQLAAESLKQLASGWTVVSIDDGARAIVNLSHEDTVFLRLVHTPQRFRSKGSARQLIEALVSEAAGRRIHAPQLIPARYERFAHRLGFKTTALRQRRMLLSLKDWNLSANPGSASTRPPGLGNV